MISPRPLSPAKERGSLGMLSAQQQPKDQPMGSQERWHNHRRNEKRSPQRPRAKPDTDQALVERVQKVQRAPDVESPHDRDAPRRASRESERRYHRKNGRNEIAIRGRDGESRWQRGRDDSWDQKAKPNKPIGMWNHQWKDCFFPAHTPQLRQEVELLDDAVRKKAHQHAESE